MSSLIFYFLFTLIVSFICSLLEATLLSTTNSYVESLDENNIQQNIKAIKGDMDGSISSILTVNTFANTLGAAGVGSKASEIFGDTMSGVIAIILTISILYFSEIFPKMLGVVYWKNIIGPASYVIIIFKKISTPFVILSKIITKTLSSKRKNQVSREEIIAFAEIGSKEGVIKSQESVLLENLLKIGDKKAKDIETPRSVIFALEADMTIEDAVEVENISDYSRIPIYVGDSDNIIGLVFSKDVLEHSVDDKDSLRLREIMVPIYIVSENLPALKVFDMFLKRKEHMFLVHDEYSQTTGIVTLEDAIEELLGIEIQDEKDKVGDMQQFAREKAKDIRKNSNQID